MPELTPLLLASLVAILSLVVVILVVVTSRRSVNEATRAAEAMRVERDRRVAQLEEEKEFLRNLDSVRFTERYFATRAAIDDRGRRLEGERNARQDRIDEIEHRMSELQAKDPEVQPEVNEIRSRLAYTLEQARRLEGIVAQVNEIGPIQIDDIRSELRERRHIAARLKGRLEYLSMSAEARGAELDRLGRERRRLQEEEERLRQEMEVTRTLGPAVDALLGVTTDRQQQIRQIEGRIQGSVGALMRTGFGGDPLADFIRAIRGEASGIGERPGLPAGSTEPEEPGDATSFERVGDPGAPTEENRVPDGDGFAGDAGTPPDGSSEREQDVPPAAPGPDEETGRWAREGRIPTTVTGHSTGTADSGNEPLVEERQSGG